VLSRAELFFRNVPAAEKSFREASAHISRKARPARKADLYFETGLLDFCQRRPTQATRRFETALGLRRRLGHPLKVLECLQGLSVSYAALGMPERRRQVEAEKRALVKRLEEALPSYEMQKAFREYHRSWGVIGTILDPEEQVLYRDI